MFYPTLLAFAVLNSPAAEAQSALEDGFAGALRGCEEWVLNPGSWIDGVAPFVSVVGLGNQMSLVAQVDAASLPPVPLRRANHYWRINSTETAGYVLIVSDELPMCHITGGGSLDLQPHVEAVLASEEFEARWEATERSRAGDVKSTTYRNRRNPSLTAVISRANAPGARLDRVQVIVTGTYAVSD